MICVNPNTPQYQEILKEVGGNPLTANEIYRQRYLKDGVDFVFEQTPELESIGTYEEYSSYLNTIFPESKEKNIFYHGLPFIENKDEYFRDDEETNEINQLGEANIRLWNYFFKSKDRASDYGDQQYAVLLDFSADYDSPEFSYKASPTFKTNDSAIVIAQGGDEYVVKNKKQIHILGSKEDVQGFKEYLENKKALDKQLTNEKLELLKIARESLSEEEASIVENLLNGDENFTDLSNFTCS